ncbi:MAG: HAMP domain-containing protein, partial [bacterium]
MRFSLRQKITAVNLALLIIVTIAASLITTYEVEQYYETRIFEQLKTQIQETEYFLSTLGFPADLSAQNYQTLVNFSLAASIRLTLIDSTGTVLFDSHVKKDSLRFVKNHLYRPEIQTALRNGIGHDERASATVGQQLFYAAKHTPGMRANKNGILKQAQFVRVAIPIEAIRQVLYEVRWKIFAGGGLAFLIIAAISLVLSKKLTDPIRELARVAESVKQGNLDAHFEHHSSDDIGDLADLLNEMVGKLRDDVIKMQKLQTMRSQFLGNVSHELRTPIFAMQGYLETFLQGKDLEKNKQRIFI